MVHEESGPPFNIFSVSPAVDCNLALALARDQIAFFSYAHSSQLVIIVQCLCYILFIEMQHCNSSASVCYSASTLSSLRCTVFACEF